MCTRAGRPTRASKSLTSLSLASFERLDIRIVGKPSRGLPIDSPGRAPPPRIDGGTYFPPGAADAGAAGASSSKGGVSDKSS